MTSSAARMFAKREIQAMALTSARGRLASKRRSIGSLPQSVASPTWRLIAVSGRFAINPTQSRWPRQSAIGHSNQCGRFVTATHALSLGAPSSAARGQYRDGSRGPTVHHCACWCGASNTSTRRRTLLLFWSRCAVAEALGRDRYRGHQAAHQMATTRASAGSSRDPAARWVAVDEAAARPHWPRTHRLRVH